MRKYIKKVLTLCLSGCLIFGLGSGYQAKLVEGSNEEKVVAKLATFIATYEYSMGVEHAQFPSGKYTNNIRTDVLYYAISTDGEKYTALNNNRPILYPNKSVKLGSPSLFRKADGSFGLIAGVDNNSTQIFLSDTEDLLTFTNDRTITLNNKGIRVSNPMVEYDPDEKLYMVYWEGSDGKSYYSTTEEFSSFTDPVECDYYKPEFKGELPTYAEVNEVSIFDLTESECETVLKKYGEIKSVAVEGLNQSIKVNEEYLLPSKLDVRYSDGSTASMGVKWNTQTDSFKSKIAGTYEITGTIQGTTVYNNPVADFRADPFILYNEADGYYYMTGSYMQADLKNAYDYVVIRRAKTINGLKDAEEVRVFSGTTKAESGVNVTPDYWAPEIHMIDGRYRILVQGTVDGRSRQCIITCDGDDLMQPSNWSYSGYIGETTDGLEIGPFDTTYFEYEGKGYYLTQHITGGSKLDITTVDPSDPTTPTGPRVSIAVPDRAYETNIGTSQSILEGPAAIAHDGKVYVTYSGATIDMHYCTNLVYADLDSDLMDPESWTKLQTPLFTTTDVTTTLRDTVLEDGNGEYEGLMGPGHSNFTVDENGNVLLVFHARDWSESYATGNDKYGLGDPGRHAYVKSVHFGADGMPILNMTSEQILSEKLRNVTIKISVSDPDAVTTIIPTVTATPTSIPTSEPVTTAAPTNIVYTVGNYKYQIKNNKAIMVGTTKKTAKVITVPVKVRIGGKNYNVSGIKAGAFSKYKRLQKLIVGKNVEKIEKKAFFECTKLKFIVVKSTKLKIVGKNAFKGINKRAVYKFPNKFKKAYMKLF